MKKTLIVIQMTFIILSLLVSPVYAQDNKEEMKKVSLQLRWDHQFQFAGYYAALWQGYYREAGFDVDIRSAIAPDGTILSATDEVANNNADFGVGAADILLSMDQGNDLILLASIFQNSAAEFYALEDTALNSPTDLLKLKVARNVNDLIDVELQVMLLSEGIDPQKIIPYKHIAGIQHLIDRSVDVVPGYRLGAPFEFDAQGIKVKTLRPITYGIDFYGDSLFTHSRMVDQSPEEVERFRIASLKGWEYALDHPEEIASKIASELPRTHVMQSGSLLEYNKYQVPVVKALSLYPFVEMGNINPHRWGLMHEQLKKVGVLKGNFDVDKRIFDYNAIELKNKDNLNRIIKLVVFIAFGVLVILFAFIYLLRKQVSAKTQSLIDSEEKFRSYTEYAPDGIFIVDDKGYYIDANPSGCAMFASSKEELLMHHILEYVMENEKQKAKEALEMLVKVGKFDGEFEFTRKDRTTFIGLMSAIKLSGHKYMGFIKDITVRKNAEMEIIKSKEEAESANKAKSQFLSNMSHEIRTPMNGFMGMLQLMETTELTEEQSELMEIAKNSTKSLLVIVNDILDYSKIEAGLIELNIRPFDLEILLSETTNLFQISANAARLNLEISIEKNIPKHLKGDSFRLKQVLSNLIGNAIKFTKEGSVELHVKVIDQITENKIKLEFVVKDTGIGIPLNQIEYLFKRFSQVDNSDTRQYGGTGLGLAICKGLVEMMDGEIWVESVEGEGSNFYFTCVLEMQSQRHLKSEQVELKTAEEKRSVKILLVEDDEVSQIYIQKIANLKGWDITLVKNGKEAVDIFNEKKFDLVLMDAQMPIMNGYKATELMRSHEDAEGLRTPIIALTAFALDDDREKCLAAGMDDYLSKPIKIEDLNAMIVKWTMIRA